jgi:REP element-mobilizing transposase RayT
MRLKDYDYSQPGFYYITICTQDRSERFGNVVDSEMILNNAGEMFDAEWNRIPERYGHVVLDVYQIMPNHMHGILEIRRRGVVSAPSRIIDKPVLIDIGDEPIAPSSMNGDNPRKNNEDPGEMNQTLDMETENTDDPGTRVGAETTPLQSPPTLGQIIGGFKYQASKTINEMDGTPGRKILQRGFHDHIIRTEDELNRIRKYIEDNPKNWETDKNNPKNIKENDDTDS